MTKEASEKEKNNKKKKKKKLSSAKTEFRCIESELYILLLIFYRSVISCNQYKCALTKIMYWQCTSIVNFKGKKSTQNIKLKAQFAVRFNFREGCCMRIEDEVKSTDGDKEIDREVTCVNGRTHCCSCQCIPVSWLSVQCIYLFLNALCRC